MRCTAWPPPACACRTPYNFLDGVLLMELVANADGDAAPRINDVVFTPEEALRHHTSLLAEVVRMLCAGVVHGDLSEFNILLAADGPVIIDLPQAVDAAGNHHAQRMLLRDVANLRAYFGATAPELLGTDYGSGDVGAVRARPAAARHGAHRPAHPRHRPGGPGRRAARNWRCPRRRSRAPAAFAKPLIKPP